jgi:hypothetical protein
MDYPGYSKDMKPTNEKLWMTCEAGTGSGDAAASSISVPPMGLNDNMVFLGKELHVQTENKGFSPPCILTQVFLNGRVVFSEKSEIPVEFHETHDYSKVQHIMHLQHSQVIQKIRDKQDKALGKF